MLAGVHTAHFRRLRHDGIVDVHRHAELVLHGKNSEMEVAVPEMSERDIIEAIAMQQRVCEIQELRKTIGRNHGVGHDGVCAPPLHDLQRVGGERVSRLQEECSQPLAVEEQDRVFVDVTPALDQDIQPLFRRVFELPAVQGLLEIDGHGVVPVKETGLVIHDSATVRAKILESRKPAEIAVAVVPDAVQDLESIRFVRQGEKKVQEITGSRRQCEFAQSDQPEQSFAADHQVHEIQASVRRRVGPPGVLYGRTLIARYGPGRFRLPVGQEEHPVQRNVLCARRGDEPSVRQYQSQAPYPGARGPGFAGREARRVAGERAADRRVGTARGIDREAQSAA